MDYPINHHSEEKIIFWNILRLSVASWNEVTEKVHRNWLICACVFDGLAINHKQKLKKLLSQWIRERVFVCLFVPRYFSCMEAENNPNPMNPILLPCWSPASLCVSLWEHCCSPGTQAGNLGSCLLGSCISSLRILSFLLVWFSLSFPCDSAWPPTWYPPSSVTRVEVSTPAPSFCLFGIVPPLLIPNGPHLCLGN